MLQPTFRLSSICLDSYWQSSAKKKLTTLPGEAGLSIGTGAMKYALLQIHYYNPDLENGLKDYSGLRIRKIPSLENRKSEAHLGPDVHGVLDSDLIYLQTAAS